MIQPYHYSALFFIEVWRPIVGYEGLYEVSSSGRIRGLKGRLCAQFNSRNGYKTATLSKSSKIKTYSVHRLVMFAFSENKYQKRTVNHIDGVKTNNMLVNLAWATHSEQLVHAISMGLKNPPPIHHLPGALSPSSVKINQINSLGVISKTHTSMTEAAKSINVAPSTMYHYCNTIGSYLRGFRWEYSSDIRNGKGRGKC